MAAFDKAALEKSAGETAAVAGSAESPERRNWMQRRGGDIQIADRARKSRISQPSFSAHEIRCKSNQAAANRTADMMATKWKCVTQFSRFEFCFNVIGGESYHNRRVASSHRSHPPPQPTFHLDHNSHGRPLQLPIALAHRSTARGRARGRQRCRDRRRCCRRRLGRRASRPQPVHGRRVGRQDREDDGGVRHHPRGARFRHWRRLAPNILTISMRMLLFLTF